MDYRIKRLVKAEDRNVNGYIFDKETTNKALDAYIGRPIVY